MMRQSKNESSYFWAKVGRLYKFVKIQFLEYELQTVIVVKYIFWSLKRYKDRKRRIIYWYSSDALNNDFLDKTLNNFSKFKNRNPGFKVHK